MVEHRNPLYIYHHLGMGDHIICNAIVRNIRKRFTNELFLFCKPQFLTSVSFMYRDIDLTVIPLDDADVIKFLKTKLPEQQIIIGHQYLNLTGGVSFDQSFYRQIGLNFNRRWDDFYTVRDKKRENELLTKVNPPKPYAFIHDDSSRNFNINRDFVSPNLNIVTPQKDLTDNIFDYLSIIQDATEIHCMDSSFKLMIDSMFKHEDLQSKLVFHFNFKNNIIKDKSVSRHRLNWITV